MNGKLRKKLISSLLVAASLTLLAASGALSTADYTLSDRLYLHEKPTDPNIVIVGMDDYALDELGPLPWNRLVYADAVNYLVSDPEYKPAVIGIDVIYSGESEDTSFDEALAKACENAANVVVAATAEFGSEIVENENGFTVKDKAVIDFSEPFSKLKAVTKYGTVNAMSDEDGNIRHVIDSINVPELGNVKSMARVVYEEYAKSQNLDTNIPSTNDGFFYLDYTGKPGAYYESISIADLVNCNIDPEYFDGKIVLIGPYASGLTDEYRTSMDHASPMYGVEIQANQIQAYLNGFFPEEFSESLQLAILFILAFAAGFVLSDKKLSAGIAIYAAAGAIYVLCCSFAYKQGIILHVLYIPLAFLVEIVINVAIHYIKEHSEKRAVINTFGRYVDPAVLSQLLKENSDSLGLGGKSYNIAVLFVDIRGFTTMSESLPPETVVEILNKYLTLTTSCIMRHHGTLDKFVGDCTMAFWNAPLPQEDPIYLACCAAMDMVKGAVPLGEELQRLYGRKVDFGVGVHYGPAVVGNIGAPQRMDYTAIGDTVNTSSRLESNAPAGTVYISRVVADALGDRARTTSLGGTIKLKGKAEGFEVLVLNELDY